MFSPTRVSLLLLLLAASPAAAAQDEELTPEHRRWLEEEVTYIITEREADTFRTLLTVEERNRFIEAFWRRRDPAPATPVNEFREEHYRRFEYANEELRGEAFSPGWRTDRGRMYIILGEPRSIETFDNYNNLLTSQLWFYQGDLAKNMPSFFYLLFFKRQDAAQYRLFQPGSDVPGDLLRGPARSFPEHDMEQLTQISPELARAALAVDASEPVDIRGGYVGLGSEVALANIESSPRLAVRTDYLDAWERYGDLVSSEYSFNFVPSESSFAVFSGPDDTAYLHFSTEVALAELPMETSRDGSRSYTTLDASLEVLDGDGRLVLADEQESFIELTEAHRNEIEGSTFAYQDSVPLVPGDYEVRLILRNRVSRSYTVAEHSLRIGGREEPNQPALSDIVLGFRTEDMAEPAGTLKTFQAGALRVHPAAAGVFAAGETVQCVFQVLGASPQHELHFALLRGGELVAEHTRPVGTTESDFEVEAIALQDIVPDWYEVRVRLHDADGSVLAEEAAPLQVSPRASVARPGVFARRSFDTNEHALLAVVLGDQYWAREDFAAAEQLFARAVAANDPDVPQAAWKLAASYLRTGRAESALGLLLPLQFEFAERYEVRVGLGIGFYMKGNLVAAVGHLEKAITLRPPQSGVLNTLGEAYAELGETEKAHAVWERSLGLDSEQPDIRQRLAEPGAPSSN